MKTIELIYATCMAILIEFILFLPLIILVGGFTW